MRTERCIPTCSSSSRATMQYGEIMAGYAVEKLGLKKIAILYDQSNAYAVSLVAPFKAYAESVGAKIVDEEVYGKTDRDYRTQLSKIKNSGADCVFAPNYIQGLVITAKQAKQLGLKMPFLGALDYAAPFASLVNDPEAANNIYFANNYSDSEPQLGGSEEGLQVRNTTKTLSTRSIWDTTRCW